MTTARSTMFLLTMVLLCGSAAAADEFVGPLAGWKNVKADYGAIGDGKTDDTVAIQRALDDLRLHKQSCVLFFPAGTYRVTKTVKSLRKAHQDCMGVTVVGEDPATTALRWDGPAGGTVFQYDAWYSKIGRLTLDGSGRAAAALAYGDAFSTYNETSDMVFKDVRVGMSMGTADDGQAENAVLRCRFLRCGRGIETHNFNSMDIWAWYCHFEDCDEAMYNVAGNFHAYGCLFERSKKADIGTMNLMAFSFVGNTSIGSRCFLDFAGGHSWGSPTSITHNRVIEPTGDFAIRLGNGGPYLVTDNQIRLAPGGKARAIEMTWGDQALIGNTYGVPADRKDGVKEAGRFVRLAEKTVEPAAIAAEPPKLPPTPPRRERRVLEVPAGADVAAIQQAIDRAAKLVGQRPVVHLPKGTYKIERTLLVPAGCDVQIVGDGAAETATVLQGAGPEGMPIFRLAGPVRATLRDFSLACGRNRGIVVENGDQPGSQIYCDQLNISGQGTAENGAGLRVLGLVQADVLLHCLQGGTFCDRWVSVLGGPSRESGKPAPGQVNIYCGATGTAEAQYHVAKGGRLVVRSVYHEVSGESPCGIRLDDSGTLSVDATRFSYKTAPDRPLVDLDGFRGDFALMSGLLLPVGTQYPAKVAIRGDGSKTRALVMADMFWAPAPGVTADGVFENAAQPPAQAALLNSNLNGGGESKLSGGFGRLDNRGTADDALILALVAPMRTARRDPRDSIPAGATDLRIHRVIVTAGKGQACVELRP